MNALMKLSKAFFIQTSRSRGALFWIFFFPVFIYIFLGFIFGDVNSGGSSDATFALAIDPALASQSPDRAPDVGILVTALGQGNHFTFVPMSREDAQKALADGKVYAFISREGAPGKPFTFLLYEKNGQVNSALLGVLDKINLGYYKQMTGKPELIQWVAKSLAIKGRGFSYLSFLLAGMIAIAVMQNSFFSVPSTIVNYRQMGFLKRFMFSPLKKSTFTISMAIVRLLLSIIQLLLLLITGILVFKTKLDINPVSFIVTFLLGTLGFTVMGFFIAGVFRSLESTNAVANIANMIFMFTAGVYFPIEIMPKFLRVFAYVNPVYYFANSLYGSMLLNKPLMGLGSNMIALALITAGFFILTLVTFRYEERR